MPLFQSSARPNSCRVASAAERSYLLADGSTRGRIAMAYVMVDVGADGPIPGDYSMICFGAVLVNEPLDQTFYGRLRPVSDRYVPEALAVSGFTRQETLTFDDPAQVMLDFHRWIAETTKGRAMFCSDN